MAASDRHTGPVGYAGGDTHADMEMIEGELAAAQRHEGDLDDGEEDGLDRHLTAEDVENIYVGAAAAGEDGQTETKFKINQPMGLWLKRLHTRPLLSTLIHLSVVLIQAGGVNSR